MWSLFSRRPDVDAEFYEKLRPGDLYGTADRRAQPPESYLRYLLLGNASLGTFAGVLLLRVAAEAPAHHQLLAAVWLAGLGAAIAAGAWLAFHLSRRDEAAALTARTPEAPERTVPAVQATMKRAAVRKMLAVRLMLVSAIAGMIGVFAGIKSLFLL